MTVGPGQKVERPSIDNDPSELGSLAIATPTLLLLVYSVHITLLLFWLALSASICDFGKSDHHFLIRVLCRLYGNQDKP